MRVYFEHIIAERGELQCWETKLRPISTEFEELKRNSTHIL